jgi:hypothetical protein
MSNKIVYVRGRLINAPTLLPVLDQYPQHDWKMMHALCGNFYGSMAGVSCRTGDNVWPFKNNIATQQWGYAPPEFQPGFKKTFADITDQRYHDLIKTKTDRPWIVLWSGGIDSTVVLTSILRNSTAEERKNIVVGCNRISIYENPNFYYKFIVPNFTRLDSTFMDLSQVANDFYVIDGDPADQLHTGAQSQAMLHRNGKDLLRNFWTDPDRLLDYLTDYTGNRKLAEWHYEKLTTNMRSVNVPLETYHDFFFWGFFNLAWVAAQLRTSEASLTYNREAQKNYFDNFVPWFSNDDYQQWAMSNNQHGIKFGNDLGTMKIESKRYIARLFSDEYYFRFKTKSDSTSRGSRADPRRFCLLDDYTWLNIDTDIDLILELLPEHINN